MKLDHVGVAVNSIAEARCFYEDLGLKCLGEEVVADQGVRIAFFSLGDTRLELLESTDLESPVAGFIGKRGPGLHHLCVRVSDLAATLDELLERGYALVDRTPRIGGDGRKVAFVHPKATGGVLLELSEE